MLKKITQGSVFGLLAALSACGDDARDGGDVLTISSALAVVTDTMSGMASLSPTASNKLALKKSLLVTPFAAGAFGSNWTASGLAYMPDSSGETVSIKEYMGRQLDPDAMGEDNDGREFAINVFGRFSQSMMIGCSIGMIAEKDSENYPAAGVQTFALNEANLAIMVADCGMAQAEADYMSSQNLEFPATISVPEDTTHYDRKVVMELPAEMGGATQTFYMRYNDTEINIQNTEDGEYDSRTFVAMDRANEFLQVEYYSGSTDGDSNTAGNQPLLYYHRLVYDKANDDGRIVTHIGQNNASAMYTLAGNPETGTDFALSWVSDFGGTTREYQACIAIADGSVGTDNSLACDETGVDVGGLTWLQTALSSAGNASWVETSDTMFPTWTVDTALSGDVVQ
jgi:hypothetical protein